MICLFFRQKKVGFCLYFFLTEEDWIAIFNFYYYFYFYRGRLEAQAQPGTCHWSSSLSALPLSPLLSPQLTAGTPSACWSCFLPDVLEGLCHHRLGHSNF